MGIIEKIRLFKDIWENGIREKREKQTAALLDKLRPRKGGEHSILFGKEYVITDSVSTIELPWSTKHFLIDNSLANCSDIKLMLNYNAPDSEYVDLLANSGLPIENIEQGIFNFKAYCPNAGETSTVKVMGIRL